MVFRESHFSLDERANTNREILISVADGHSAIRALPYYCLARREQLSILRLPIVIHFSQRIVRSVAFSTYRSQRCMETAFGISEREPSADGQGVAFDLIGNFSVTLHLNRKQHVAIEDIFSAGADE